ncbi:MAG: hypothetical protein WC260_02325 [Candidatus Pacearchaeota archaeon]
MGTHPRDIKGYEGKLEELAKSVARMTYDQTALFIKTLADDLIQQANLDSSSGKEQLATKLYETANHLYHAKNSMYFAWKICEPYMKE